MEKKNEVEGVQLSGNATTIQLEHGAGFDLMGYGLMREQTELAKKWEEMGMSREPLESSGEKMEKGENKVLVRFSPSQKASWRGENPPEEWVVSGTYPPLPSPRG